MSGKYDIKFTSHLNYNKKTFKQIKLIWFEVLSQKRAFYKLHKENIQINEMALKAKCNSSLQIVLPNSFSDRVDKEKNPIFYVF